MFSSSEMRSPDIIFILYITYQCFECFFVDVEIQLCGKSDAAHHAQRIVAERDVGVEWGTDDSVFHVLQAVKRVDEFSEPFVVKTDCHCVDGEVASVLVVLERTVFNDRFT